MAEPSPTSPGNPEPRPAVEQAPAPPRPAPPPRAKRRWRLWAGLAVLVLLSAAVAGYYQRYIAPFESTDDAFIEGHVTTVSPRVSGPVIHLLVEDNQVLKEGDLLLEIDPRDYETKLAQVRADLAVARSQLEQTRSQTVVDEARAAQQAAAVTAAEAEARRTEADLKRYQSAESRAVSRSQLDLAQAQSDSSAAALLVTRNQVKAAEAQVGLDRVLTETAAAAVAQAEAKVRQAELDLSYTKVTAPVAGRVTRRSVEQGAYISTGQSLLALVPADVWVVANFKETQLVRIRPGQPVRMRVDAYRDRKFTGKVESLQAGTGARFTLLPPENAVGNYVKVVQRVPVKILFDGPLDPQLDFAPGMSVTPEVRVR